VFGINQGAVDTTIAAGRVLMENKKLKLDIDETEICRKSRVTGRQALEEILN